MHTACKHRKHKPKYHNRYHFSFHNFTPFCFSLYHSLTYTVNNTLFCIFSVLMKKYILYLPPIFFRISYFAHYMGTMKISKKGRNISALNNLYKAPFFNDFRGFTLGKSPTSYMKQSQKTGTPLNLLGGPSVRPPTSVGVSSRQIHFAERVFNRGPH